MVHNEANIIRVNILYHLSIGFDRLLIVDNDSTDGTDRILRDLGRDPRVRWTRDAGPFRQGEVFAQLAREAFHEGADWVAPLDADDFWYARRGSLRHVLEKTSASVLRVKHVDFVQRREQHEHSYDELLYMTRRVPEPVTLHCCHQSLFRSKQISYIQLARAPKMICRPSRTISMSIGAHQVSGVDGPTLETSEIILMHAPLRSLAHLETRAASASRRGSLKEPNTSGPGWPARRWRTLQEKGTLKQEWAANSYESDSLDVYGECHLLIFDPTLRNAVAPFVQGMSKAQAARRDSIPGICSRTRTTSHSPRT